MLDYMMYQEKRRGYLAAVERKIEQVLAQDGTDEYNQKIIETVKYALSMDTRRVHPLLMMATVEYFGLKPETCLSYAIALEFMYTYRMVHDDLPGLDDDDTRMGRPTVHRRYGNGLAVLAGDYLLNKAYEMVIEESAQSKAHYAAARQMAKAGGLEGLISGQSIDLQTTLPPFGSKVKLTNAQREEYFKIMLDLDQRKTGAMLSLAFLIPANLAEARMEDFVTFTRLGQRLGLAYQVKDDIVDAEKDKMSSTNLYHSKLTVVRLFGLKNSTIYYDNVCNEVRECYNLLNKMNGRADFLMTAIEDLLQRQA